MESPTHRPVQSGRPFEFTKVDSATPSDIQAPLAPPFKHIEPLRATRFAGPYLPHFPPAFKLDNDDFQKFGGLNCSYFSHSSGQVPTLWELKEHARALTKLVKLIDVQDMFSDGPAFDWLVKLDEVYKNDNFNHQTPLDSLKNTIVSGTDADGFVRIKQGCSLEESRPFYWRMASHANEILENLDKRNADAGGLLGLLPPEGSEERELAAQSLLGQYLIYTTELVKRVGQLESEIEHYRTILGGEALIPAQLHKDNPHDKEGRPIAFPQDRFILGDIKPELWAMLDNLLSKSELEHTPTRRDISGKIVPALRLKPHEKALRPFENLKPIAKVPLECIFYRVRGSQSIFIVPAKNNHPNLRHSQELLNQHPQVIITSVSTVPSQGEPCGSASARFPHKLEPETNPQLVNFERINDDLSSVIHELTTKQNSNKAYADTYLNELNKLAEPFHDIVEFIKGGDVDDAVPASPQLEKVREDSQKILDLLEEVLLAQTATQGNYQNLVDHIKKVLYANKALFEDLDSKQETQDWGERIQGKLGSKTARDPAVIKLRQSNTFPSQLRRSSSPLRQEFNPQPTMSGALGADDETLPGYRSPSPHVIDIPESLADIPPRSVLEGLPRKTETKSSQIPATDPAPKHTPPLATLPTLPSTRPKDKDLYSTSKKRKSGHLPMEQVRANMFAGSRIGDLLDERKGKRRHVVFIPGDEDKEIEFQEKEEEGEVDEGEWSDLYDE